MNPRTEPENPHIGLQIARRHQPHLVQVVGEDVGILVDRAILNDHVVARCEHIERLLDTTAQKIDLQVERPPLHVVVEIADIRDCCSPHSRPSRCSAGSVSRSTLSFRCRYFPQLQCTCRYNLLRYQFTPAAGRSRRALPLRGCRHSLPFAPPFAKGRGSN